MMKSVSCDDGAAVACYLQSVDDVDQVPWRDLLVAAIDGGCGAAFAALMDDERVDPHTYVPDMLLEAVSGRHCYMDIVETLLADPRMPPFHPSTVIAALYNKHYSAATRIVETHPEVFTRKVCVDLMQRAPDVDATRFLARCVSMSYKRIPVCL